MTPHPATAVTRSARQHTIKEWMQLCVLYCMRSKTWHAYVMSALESDRSSRKNSCTGLFTTRPATCYPRKDSCLHGNESLQHYVACNSSLTSRSVRCSHLSDSRVQCTLNGKQAANCKYCPLWVILYQTSDTAPASADADNQTKCQNLRMGSFVAEGTIRRYFLGIHK